MGTIADKLNYLNNTKSKLKNEINKIGGSITDETTFRDYVSNINNTYDKLPKVEGSGSDITLNDTEEALLSLTPEGYASQEKTTGKNLYNDNAETTRYYINNSGEFVLGSNNDTFIETLIDSNIASSYSISYKEKIGTSYVRFSFFNEENIISRILLAENNTNLSVPIGTTKIYIHTDKRETKYFDRLQIEEGSTSTEYETFTGGQASPKPEYPQPIKVVTGEQNVEISGKNHFDKSQITNLSTYNCTAVINDDKSITMTSSANNGYAIIRPFFNFKANKTYTISFEVDDITKFNHMYLFKSTSSTSGGYSKNNYVTTTRTVDSLLGIGIYPNNGETITISNIQIEEGSTATEYEPYYTPQNYPLPLGNIELARINDYKDFIFKNEIGSKYYNADLEEDSWYVGKQIKKLIFDGTQKIHSISASKTRTTRVTYQSFAKKSVAQVLISNRFDGYNNKYNGDSTSIAFNVDNGDNTDLWFRILKTTIGTTKEEINQWLSENNIVVYFPIVTSYEKITDTTLIQQLENMNNNARSYKGTTIIECSSASEENETLQVSTVALKDLDLLTATEETQSTQNISEIKSINESLSLNNEIESEVSE